MRLLHLSDIHVESTEQAELQLHQLNIDLRDSLELESVDAIVVSGDISVKATRAEFDASAFLLKQLLQDRGMSPKQLVLVPGNHDVNWGVTKQALVKIAKKKSKAAKTFPHESNSSYVYEVDAAKYAQRFADFSDFYQSIYQKPYPTDPAEQFEVWEFPEHKTVILGLNSAWDLNHVVRDQPAIHQLVLPRAFRKLRETHPDSSWTHIAVWHHPIQSSGDDRIRDDGFVRQLAQSGFSICLHGHIHDISTDSFRYEWGPDAESMHILAAGTFGASTKELPTATPWGYNVLEIEDGYVEVHARQRRTVNGIWEPFGAWRKNSKETAASIRLPLRGHAHANAPLSTRADLRRHLEELGVSMDGYRIAVEAHIFDSQGRVLLQKRGPQVRDEIGKFEGVGGDIRLQDDLQAALQKEVKAELGPDVEICIDKLLEVRKVPFVERGNDVQNWLVVSYLCRLVAGEPRAMDPGRTAELRYFTVQEWVLHSQAELSRSTILAISTYWARYGERPYFRD